MTFDPAELKRFLVEAKRATYAAQGDDASVAPLLSGSKQLEYRKGRWFYRDVYVGMSYFIGQEIVYLNDAPLWSMSYAGGLSAAAPPGKLKDIYAFLRAALRDVPLERPFRGPDSLVAQQLRYANECSGSVERFRGIEFIRSADSTWYELWYAGGLTA